MGCSRWCDCWLLDGSESMSKNILPASEGLTLQGEQLSQISQWQRCLQSDQEDPALPPVCDEEGRGPRGREARPRPASPLPPDTVLPSFAWLTWVPVGSREREEGEEHGGGGSLFLELGRDTEGPC